MHYYYIALQAVCFLLLVLIIKRVFFKANYGNTKYQYVPGMKAKSPELGNLDTIGEAGSLHQFLVKLHQAYGDIASFWLGPQYVVSICSPDLFKEHQGVFDRPAQLFQLLEPFIGPKSIQFANKEDGKYRRKCYDRSMSHQAVKKHITQFQSVADETINRWEEERSLGVVSHALCSTMVDFALKAGLVIILDISESKFNRIGKFHKDFGVCWNEMEARLTDIPAGDSEREHLFQEALAGAIAFIKEIVTERQTMVIAEIDRSLIDIMIEVSPDEETLLSDAITYVTGSFHTTANYLAWGFYYLANDKDVQNRLFLEILEVFGKSGQINYENLAKMTYLKQVQDETLRCSLLAPFAARFLDDDSTLGGFHIPAGTPVVHALGVSCLNPVYFPNPEVFDPERFNAENIKNRPRLAFKPFGFAGQRVCPGHRFANLEASVMLVTMIRKFEIGLVEGQEVTQKFGFAITPSKEIMVTLNPRM